MHTRIDTIHIFDDKLFTSITMCIYISEISGREKHLFVNIIFLNGLCVECNI